MSSLKNHINSTHAALGTQIRDALHVNGYHATPPRCRTPNGLNTPAKQSHLGSGIEELGAEEDPKMSVFRELYGRSEARLGSLFEEKDGDTVGDAIPEDNQPGHQDGAIAEDMHRKVTAPPKKAARAIDEDDYDESDGEDEAPTPATPLKSKTAAAVPVIAGSPSTPMKRHISSNSAMANIKRSSSSGPVKSSEDVRKKLEEDKKATEDAAKRSFHTLFYTLENDRDAMLDQKKLEESERQVDVEMGGTVGGHNVNGPSSGSAQQGTLSQTNLGASSLTFKHLIARIDAKRDQVLASDAELRSLMSEVRKNRSKWASEEKVGQEELYEAAERVLTELKAYTEHSTAFLTRVNKREAPDYYNVIKHPMDLGTMTKKLKAVQYKSKQEFVDDLSLIWANCLRYNANPEHLLRRHALFMRKKAEELVPMIPAIVIKDRADVEAEERRLLNGDADMDGGEESDDEPIISSRGRKAPGKKSKKGSAARKAPAGVHESSPAADVKPSLHALNSNGLGSNLKNENLLRADSESVLDGSTKDLSTPPPGAITPVGVNGVLGHGLQHPGAMDIDGIEPSINGVGSVAAGMNEEAEREDIGYKTWKQVTKKDRALVTAERHRLFKGDHLNPDEPALLRNKMGMRRWLRKQKQAVAEGALGKPAAEAESLQGQEPESSGETLAEGMEGDEERVLPDYYDTLAAMPDLSSRLRWIEDATGEVQDPSGEFLRILPQGLFTSPESCLTKRIEDNMRQMQQTRKICSKIAVVKQMQIQAQMYHGQFQKHEPAPFVEQDIEPHVMSDDGPVVSPWVSRAALQRSVGKLFFHAGFDECQPAALDAITDLAGDFFTKIARTLNEYNQTPKIAVPAPVGTSGDVRVTWKDRFTAEEIALHTLHENGCDIEALETYVKDDVERSSTKLAVMHDRMKAHLADLLRPALNDAGPDGSNAFNDGSEQFVGGDFAEELGEDFFGFKELGLDQELGLASLAVPLHLLQNRVHRHNQAQNPSSSSSALPTAHPPPTPLTPVTVDNIKSQIGLVQEYFLKKLHANNDQPLIEDDDLPQKQRFPKPRLPPTGKISSPRKRPLREQGPGKGHPRKKIKLDDGKGDKGVVPFPKLKAVGMERSESGDSRKEAVKEKEKEKDVAGMMSPESLEAT